MDDYCTGNISDIKNRVFYKEARKLLEGLLGFNVGEMVDEVLLNARMNVTPEERNAYVLKLEKSLHLDIDTEGNVKICI